MHPNDLFYIFFTLFPFIGKFTGLSPAPKELLYHAYERAANSHINIVGENEDVSLESTVQPIKMNE